MLHKVEPKIRRMEYRLAFAPLSSTPSALASEALPDQTADAKSPDKKSRDDFALLAVRLQELEEQLRERDITFQQKLEAETTAAFERGRGEEDLHRTAVIEEMACSMERALAEFSSVRNGYLAQVEQEVVRLALSIATRILHREAQMDPLLLSGAVRVALGQLSDTTEARLRVPASQFQLWSEMIHLMPNLPLRPQLVADDALQPGECTLETHLGSVDLGVKAQLAEIERGFFDLLEHREPARRGEFKAGTKLEEV
ncbi:MAG TPA: FliH/SctL family protein [Alloacidobacterium sp.]|nr:FliH/SctL family protein [Alloacidobacterium sp.]